MSGISKSNINSITVGPEFVDTLFDTNPIPMWIFDRESMKFLAVNKAALCKYGYSKEEFLSMKSTDIRPPEDVVKFTTAIAAVTGSTFRAAGEWRHKLKSGEVIDVDIHATELIYDGKEATLSILYDVTERKRNEAHLRQSLERLETIFEGSRDAIFISDANSTFIAVNAAACELTGYSRDELLKMKIPDLHDEQDLDAFNQRHDSILAGEAALTESVIRRKDGTKTPVEFNNRRVFLGGNPYMHTTARDISASIRVQEDLKIFQLLFKNMTEMMMVVREKDKRIVEVNDAVVKNFGYTRDELVLMTISDLRDDNSRKNVSRDYVYTGVEEVTYETVNRRKDGTVFPVEVRQKHISFNGEKMFVGIARDLTERMHAAAELRQSQLKYQGLIDTMPLGHYVSTSAGRFVDVNPAFCDMLGYTREEMMEMHIPSMLYFHETERVGESRYNGFAPATEIYRLRSKDGSEVWFADYARYIRDDSGRIVLHEGLCQDITTQKRIKEALEYNESRYRAVIENSSDAIVLIDTSARLTEILNAASFEGISGYPAEERIGIAAFDLVHPDDIESVREKFFLVSVLGEHVQTEFRVKRKDGSWMWIEATARNMLNDPFVKSIFVIIRDIDKRKTAEREVAESEERYRLLIDNSPDSVVVITDGKFAYVNPATMKSMGAERPEDLIGKPILDFIEPDSKEKVSARINEMMTSKAPAPADELRLHRLDGSVLEVDVRSTPVKYLGKPSVQSVIRNITSKKRVEEQLLLQGVALNTAANAVLITDTKGYIAWVNRAFESLTGYTFDEAVGKNPRDLIKSGKHDEKFYGNLWETISAGHVWHGELTNRKKDGTLYNEYMTIAPVRDSQGVITHYVGVKQDITQRKSLEEQLFQSQKLESIGQLAGGVAHDYNNILGVVIGYAELLKSKLKDDFETRKPVEYILTAAMRGADLTRQLLAFARKEMISPRVVNINESVGAIQKMLQRIIGENIKLEFTSGKNLWNVKLDPSQLDQVLVNMAANARDAIKGIGTIKIETANVVLSEEEAKSRSGMLAGEFVRLTISDTGCGMDDETTKRIFEPFFTTKQKGQGTGLGLSTVYGIIKQNNGSIFVSSIPGAGTTFEIYFQRSMDDFTSEADHMVETTPRGTGTVLVVEDQPDMLELVRVTLEQYGYHVLTAPDPSEALLLCEAFSDTIHLLLTDVIMPTMSGKALSERVKTRFPKIKTLFMSGYTASELDPEGVLKEGVEFIQKPFTPVELAKKVNGVLAA